MTEVDQKEVKKEEIIDMDVRILARSKILKMLHTTSIHSQQQRDHVQMPPTRVRTLLPSITATDT